MQDILQRLDVKTLAILHLNDEFGVSIAKELSSQFKGKIVIEAFEGKTQEFETQVLKLQDAKPDACLSSVSQATSSKPQRQQTP